MSDTIAAIATAAGPGGVGVVRVSGPRARAIAAQFVAKPKPRYAHFAPSRQTAALGISRNIHTTRN